MPEKLVRNPSCGTLHLNNLRVSTKEIFVYWCLYQGAAIIFAHRGFLLPPDFCSIKLWAGTTTNWLFYKLFYAIVPTCKWCWWTAVPFSCCWRISQVSEYSSSSCTNWPGSWGLYRHTTLHDIQGIVSSVWWCLKHSLPIYIKYIFQHAIKRQINVSGSSI